MQSRETGRMTKTKSSSNPIAPSEPQQWGSFRFRNTAFSTNRNARACRESRSHRYHRQPPDSACAHGDPPRPPPPKKSTDRYNLKRASFVSIMCIRAIVRPVLFYGNSCPPRAAPLCRARMPVAATDKSPSTLRTVGASSGGWATGAEARSRRIAHDAATPPTPQ